MPGLGPGVAAALPHASPPPPPPACAAVKQASHDRQFGALAAILWGATAWHIAPLVTPYENWQSLAGIAASEPEGSPPRPANQGARGEVRSFPGYTTAPL